MQLKTGCDSASLFNAPLQVRCRPRLPTCWAPLLGALARQDLAWVTAVSLRCGGMPGRGVVCGGRPRQLCEKWSPGAAQGYAFGVLSAILSAVAAVYTEWVMKQNADSLYWQNMQLYSFGVAFNALGLCLADFRSGAHSGSAPSLSPASCALSAGARLTCSNQLSA